MSVCAKSMPDQWGWQVFRRCQKARGHRGPHIAEDCTSFGGALYTAIMRDGDDHATEYTSPEQRKANRALLKKIKAEEVSA